MSSRVYIRNLESHFRKGLVQDNSVRSLVGVATVKYLHEYTKDLPRPILTTFRTIQIQANMFPMGQPTKETILQYIKPYQLGDVLEQVLDKAHKNNEQHHVFCQFLNITKYHCFSSMIPPIKPSDVINSSPNSLKDVHTEDGQQCLQSLKSIMPEGVLKTALVGFLLKSTDKFMIDATLDELVNEVKLNRLYPDPDVMPFVKNYISAMQHARMPVDPRILSLIE